MMICMSTGLMMSFYDGLVWWLASVIGFVFVLKRAMGKQGVGKVGRNCFFFLLLWPANIPDMLLLGTGLGKSRMSEFYNGLV